MKINSIFDKILHYVSVPKCICCKEKIPYGTKALCEKCKVDYEEQKLRNCSRCSKILSSCNCSNFYLEKHFVKNLVKVYRYYREEEFEKGNRLIYSLKQDNREDVYEFLTQEVIEALNNSYPNLDPKTTLITNVPRRRRAINEYGFDHSSEIAKRIAKRLKIEYKPLLVSKSKKAQKEVAKADRQNNALFDYKVKETFSLSTKTVILFDDIVTTGASMGACATLIKGLRPKRIIGLCIAVAYRDSYTPFLRIKEK